VTTSEAMNTDLIDSVELPIVVVDRDTAVARFNVAAASLLSLSPSDTGRPVRDLRALAELVIDVEELCEHVIEGGAASQREVRARDGSWFVVRIAPYAGGDGQNVGAVLTVTNVTGFRASLEQAIHEREYTKTILNTVVEPLVVLDAELRVQTANRAFYAMFQVSREET
jgi:two-component system CheB/CheR fusion protein